MDPFCFQALEELRRDLRETFEPPKNEFRARMEYLALKQSSKSLHVYIQEARYLISNVLHAPIDESTKGFNLYEWLKGRRVRNKLFCVYPSTMEQVINGGQEEISMRQARPIYLHNPLSTNRVYRDYHRSEPMDVSLILYKRRNMKHVGSSVTKVNNRKTIKSSR